MLTIKVKIFDVVYDITEEDLCDTELSESEILDKLPKSFIYELLLEQDDLDATLERLADLITEETGWLVKNFTYRIL